MSHYAYAEVLPLAPALPAAGEGLAALFPLIAWGICLSLLYIWRRSIGAVFEHLANLLDAASFRVLHVTVRPFGFIAAELRRVDQAVQAALDAGAKATERATVYLFNKAMATFRSVGTELYHLAEDAGRALDALVAHTIPHLVQVGIHRLEHEVKQSLALAARLEHSLVRPLERLVHRLEATVERDFGIARRGIDVTRRDLARAERAIKRDAARISKVEAALGLAAFSGLLVRALSRLGLRWLRCGNVNRVGRQLCGMNPNVLESLLADALLVAGALSIVELAEEMQGVVGESAGLIQRFWKAA